MIYTQIRENFTELMQNYVDNLLDKNYSFKDKEIAKKFEESGFNVARTLFICIVPVCLIYPIMLFITSVPSNLNTWPNILFFAKNILAITVYTLVELFGILLAKEAKTLFILQVILLSFLYVSLLSTALYSIFIIKEQLAISRSILSYVISFYFFSQCFLPVYYYQYYNKKCNHACYYFCNVLF